MVARELHDHIVDFYGREADLARRVSGYLAEGIRRGEAAVVIATPEHRTLFAEGLAGRGIDVAGCRASGLLHEGDAETLLSSFSVAGLLDPERFEASVGALIGAARRFDGIRIVGEMVHLLWLRGDVLGAIALESAWNELARRYDFSLCCCYRSDSVRQDQEALARVRDLHSDVVSAPRSIGWVMQRAARRFPPLATSPRAARRFVADRCRRWGLEGHVDAACLIVSELSTNGVLHAETPFEVAVSRASAALRIAVRDESRAVPVVLVPADAAATGRGMAIVSAVAAAWGVESGPDGKTVWAELAISPR